MQNKKTDRNYYSQMQSRKALYLVTDGRSDAAYFYATRRCKT
nr:MAG TPA: hypothetical protein [Caudoviricetes sp.]